MAEIPRTYVGDAGHRSSRSWTAQRWGALIAGAALTIYGIKRRSPLGALVALGGGALATFGSTQESRATNRSARTTLLINCTPQEVYRFWRNFENLPRFMNRLESITVLDNRRSRWVVLGPVGRTIKLDVEITTERENEYVAWESIAGSGIHMDGRVDFSPAPAGRGTLVSLMLGFRAPVSVKASFVNFLNKGAHFAILQDLGRLEALIETGEIPTTEGQPHGPRDRITGAVRVADPSRPIRPGSNLRDVFEARRRSA